MSLLPRHHAEFQLQSYWEGFFSKRRTPFEWYGEYADLCHVLHKYMKPSSNVLMVGCGNSKLSEDLYDAGIINIANIDISEIVIKQMSARNNKKRPKMSFSQMDALNMNFKDESFDCVLDKGTLDAIFSKVDEGTTANTDQMWLEIHRVLKVAGRYVCITLAQEHILKRILTNFCSEWLLRVHKVYLSASSVGGVGSALPVMVFVMTKMVQIKGRPSVKVFEVVEEDGRCVRCDCVEGVREFVQGAQQYAMTLHYLKSLHPGEPGFRLQLCSSTVPDHLRYSFTIVDQSKCNGKNGPFAMFLVPQGRETEWLFSTDGGHRQLAETAGFQRLVIVSLHCGQVYGALDEVKEEVSAQGVRMLQDGVDNAVKHPILTTGDGMGKRVCLYMGSSACSGQFSVEECEGERGDGNGWRVRRLVFLAAPHLAQTEMRMQAVKPSKQMRRSSKSKKLGCFHSARLLLKPDTTYLYFSYHRAIIATLTLGRLMWEEDIEDVKGRVLVIGLGGGALPNFIHQFLPQVCVEVVELDPAMVEVSQHWFGFPKECEKMKVHVEDGVDFIRKQAKVKDQNGSFSAIILDVDSKNLSSGMSSPPSAFVESHTLNAVKALLRENGIFITNVAARNQSMRDMVYSAVQQVFPTVAYIPLDEDVNEILLALPHSQIALSQLSAATHNVQLTAEEQARKPENSICGGESLFQKDVGLSQKESLLATSVNSIRSSKLESSRNSELFSESIIRRVSKLVRVIRENGGDVEGFEKEITEFMSDAVLLK